MLKITNLNVNLDIIPILEGINLEINEGEIHAILGPNGAGKSTLAGVIAGHPAFSITKGKLNFKRKILNSLSPDERSKMGIFSSFQDPPDMLGISNLDLINLILKSKGDSRTSADISNEYKSLVKDLELGSEWGNREFNLGASNGERKKNELIHLHMTNPELAILDDIDSGLDIDSLQNVAVKLKKFLSQKGKAGIIITQQPTILDTVRPTHVHIIVNGKIVKSGDRRIIKRIIENGYREFS